MKTDREGQKGLSRAAATRQLARMTPKARIDALLSEADARRAVRQVPTDLLYSTISEVGMADATELVQLASPAQFQSLVDLGTWKKDTFDARSLLTWLRAARGDDDEAFLEKLDRMDMELLELLLRDTVEIHDLEEQPDYQPEGVTMESPEGKYLLEFKVDGIELSAVRSLLNDLFARDPFAAGRLLEAVRWELLQELEEAAYRFRSARLADLGFPELYEALALFTFVNPQDVLKSKGSPDTSAAIEKGTRVDYLDAAMERLEDDERDRAEEELRHVVNQVLVAEGADPGDLDALRRVAEHAKDYLSLGLELLCGGRPEQAVEALRETPFKRVFQLGFSLTLELKFRAERMLKPPLSRVAGMPLLLEEEARVVAPLLRKRPTKAVKVSGAEPMTFRARREIWEVGQTLSLAEVQVAVFRALLGGTPEEAQARVARFEIPFEQLGPDLLFASAVAHAVLEGRAECSPLPRERLVELAKQVVENGASGPTVSSSARSKALQVVSAAVAPADPTPMVDRILHSWVEEWGPAFLAGGTVDPKFVTTLPLRR